MKVEKPTVLTARTAQNTEEVRQTAGHCLYVEGDEGSIDFVVLNALFRDVDGMQIEGMGPCFSITNVAEALYYGHPHYYFLIDRDGQDDHVVEALWSNFPDPNTKNLLVWRRKEIENYFIDPDFIGKFRNAYENHPDYEIGSHEEFVNLLQREANKRIYLDAANRVILKVRQQLNQNRFELFSGPQEFDTEENAFQRLVERLDLQHRLLRDREIVESLDLKKCFADEIQLLLGGMSSCVVGHGKWLEFMGAKKILNAIVSSNFFRVRDRDGNQLHGTMKLHVIAKAMTGLSDQDLPVDFQLLKQLILTRLYGHTE